MKKLSTTICTLSLLAFSSVEAKEVGQPPQKNECQSMTFHHGDILKRMKRFEDMLGKLATSKNPTKDINAFLAKHGLPIRAAQSSKHSPPKDRIEDGMSSEVVVFLKTLKSPPKAGFGLDEVYEFASADAKKPLRKFTLPGNSPTPKGFVGNDVVVDARLGNPCSGTARDVLLRISADGTMRAIDDFKAQGWMDVPGDLCKAKAIYKDSAYGACASITDDKGKKRVLVYQEPMT